MKKSIRRLGVLLTLLLLAFSLSLPSRPAKCADKYCDNCKAQCEEDYQGVIDQCMAGGDSLLVCQIRNANFVHNCGVVFCSECPWVD